MDFSTVQDPIQTRRIQSAIRTANADIVCLQETNAQWESQLLCTNYPHSYFHPPHHRPASGLAILSKFPIQSHHVMDFSKSIPGSVFPALFVTLQIPNNHSVWLLRLANIHLRPPLEWNGTATLSTPRTTRPIRIQELHHYTSSSHGSSLDLMVGDFNEQDTHLNQMIMTNNYSWRNALTEFVPKTKETHIWPFAYHIFALKKRLDHLFYNTQTLTCHSCTVIPGYEYGASDHQPVLAQFTFRNS